MSPYAQWTVGDCNTVVFDAPEHAVFDLITQARFWRKWHNGHHGIAGVVHRPYRVGDTVYEYVVLNDGRESHLYWQCVEQDFPRTSLIVEHQLGVGLYYRLVEDRPGQTAFTRTTLYRPDSTYGEQERRLIAESSASSVVGLYEHVSGLLAEERRISGSARRRFAPVGHPVEHGE